MFKLIYFALWWVKCRILGRQIPIQSVVFITNKCNLSCKHCSVFENADPQIKKYDEITDEFKKCFALGSRIIDIEGGEPLLWSDGEKNINDLIKAAKKIGFFSTTVTTNAQQPIECDSDLVWVSLDGTEKFHDEIRGEGTFKKAAANIEKSQHPCINVNMTINKLNYTCVEKLTQFVKEHPKIKSVSYNFYTPYEENRFNKELQVDTELKNQIIDKIIAMKKKKYPVMNSLAALKLMKKNDFKKYCWITNFVMPDGSFEKDCSGKDRCNCKVCGYCMGAEMACVYNLVPETILAGLKVRKTK